MIRIAKLVEPTDSEMLKVIGVLLKVGGGAYSVCLVAQAVKNVNLILIALIKIGGISAITLIVNFLLSVFTNGLFRKIPLVNRISAIAVVVAATWDDTTKAISWLVENQQEIFDAAEKVSAICKAGTDYASGVST